jgi:hypothetical protein
MKVEIKDVHLLLPALVTCNNDGQEFTVFIYIDQAKKDVIIPDPATPAGIIDSEHFKEAFFKYYNKKNPAYKTPILPSSDIFNKVDPTKFKGDFDGPLNNA